jgi:hypothetical protein
VSNDTDKKFRVRVRELRVDEYNEKFDRNNYLKQMNGSYTSSMEKNFRPSFSINIGTYLLLKSNFLHATTPPRPVCDD